MLFWRLGTLEYGTQERWGRAPEKRGMWAFPWPYFELFLAYHKYRDLCPKRFARTKNRGWPASAEWYERNGESVASVEFDDEGVPVDPHLSIRDAYHKESDEWFKTVGQRVLPLRKFWYEGDLYSHISRKGEVGNPGTMGGTLEDTDWYRMDAMDFASAVRKARGDRYSYMTPEGIRTVPSSRDHLEVFIPPNSGKIFGGKSL